MNYHEASDEQPAVRLSSYGVQPVDLVVSIVSQAFNVGPDEIVSTRRGEAHIAWARHVAMYLAHTSLGIGQRHVACRFKRDRTTVGHACQRIEDSRDDPATDRILNYLEMTLKLDQLHLVDGFHHA